MGITLVLVPVPQALRQQVPPPDDRQPSADEQRILDELTARLQAADLIPDRGVSLRSTWARRVVTSVMDGGGTTKHVAGQTRPDGRPYSFPDTVELLLGEDSARTILVAAPKDMLESLVAALTTAPPPRLERDDILVLEATDDSALHRGKASIAARIPPTLDVTRRGDDRTERVTRTIVSAVTTGTGAVLLFLAADSSIGGASRQFFGGFSGYQGHSQGGFYAAACLTALALATLAGGFAVSASLAAPNAKSPQHPGLGCTRGALALLALALAAFLRYHEHGAVLGILVLGAVVIGLTRVATSRG